MGKKPSPSRVKLAQKQPLYSASNKDSSINCSGDAIVAASASASNKKKTVPRLWMRFDRSGQSELIECDKSTIIKRFAIPSRDMRILGPVFSRSSNILPREKAIVVNLEFITAIVTAEEVLLLDPLRKEVLPVVDQLRQQLSVTGPSRIQDAGHSELHEKEMSSTDGQGSLLPEAAAGLQQELPFEFRVLEIALEVVCTSLKSSVVNLENTAYPVLDELVRNVSKKNVESVRILKSNLTSLLARIQKVRDEIERLLDDNEDMKHLYLTRKRNWRRQSNASVLAGASSAVINAAQNEARLSSTIRSNASIVTSIYSNDHDVVDLEMLLEAYFMQLDGMHNKILLVRKYIDDTEDYVNIRLDNQRNELIQLQLVLTIASFAIAIEILVCGILSLNIPCTIFNIHGIFGPVVGGMSAASFMIFLLIVGYARRKRLLGS